MSATRSVSARDPRAHGARHRQGAAFATLLMVLGGCSPSASTGASPQDSAKNVSTAIAGPLRAASPWLQMSDSGSGVAVWPSGPAFLLLHTTDGWARVTNITPIAVPTGGGLTFAAGSGELVVAALPFDQLLFSPLLRRPITAASWTPGQTPGALAPGRNSVAISPRGVTAVLRAGGGTVVEDGQKGWRVLTDAARLAPGRRLQLDGLSWGVRGRGWLTGHGPGGSHVAFTTTDFGATWSAVGGLGSDVVAALTPCGGEQQWTMPVIRTGGTVALAATSDGGATWVIGAPLTLPAGVPAWGCHGREVWMLGVADSGEQAGRQAGDDSVYSSINAGLTWTKRGPAPAGVSDLAPTGDHRGFATSTTSKGPVLWAVSGDGASFSPMALPGWVASFGDSMVTHD
ncbi:MAG: hypothetical protein ABI934_04920 [Actinomycetota bacterium]